MKLSNPFQRLLHQREVEKDMYLSLVISHMSVSGCVWSLDPEKKLDILGCEQQDTHDATWEERIEVTDAIISKLQDIPGVHKLQNTVFGFVPEFLTDSGELVKTVRPDLKRMTQALGLKPVGFVPIETAIVFQLKNEEGVPPSIILLYVTEDTIELSLYRVGAFMGKRVVPISEFIVEDVETAIKSFSDMEVLPSRILLYGDSKEYLEKIKSQLLTYQWTTRANFLHYPTIDTTSLSDLSRAVALAGASELLPVFQDDTPEETTENAAIAIAQSDVLKENKEDASEELQDSDAIDPKISLESDDEEVNEVDVESIHANVVPVAPEVLGFKESTDILEEPENTKPDRDLEQEESEEQKTPQMRLKESFLQIVQNIRSMLHKKHDHDMGSKRKVGIPIVIAMICVLGMFGLSYYLIPQSTIIISVIPNTTTKEKAVLVSTTATAVDATKFIVPGKKQEQMITGEKTTAVTGKKKIGDPAKGAVTIYNKSVTGRTLKKGTILTTDTLKFTIDSDVEVASASESIGSITFGKTNASVTAVAIGEEGNIQASKEFVFQDISSSVLIARNDQPFSGGTSRETTVVSRNDYDALVKVLTEELVVKAQGELSTAVGGGDKLIEETIKTTVTNKIFTEELDQEATELHGKITVSVSGISYSEQDIKGLLQSLASENIPQGYVINEARSTTSITKPVVKKDGSISMNASIALVSIPTIDVTSLQNQLKGKNIENAKEELKKLQGVQSAEFFFRHSPTKARLPMKSSNIKIEVIVGQ